MPQIKLSHAGKRTRDILHHSQSEADHQALQPGVLIRLEADFDEDGAFGRRFLEVTAKEVRVLEWDDVASLSIPIEEIASARNEPLIGGGRLEVTTKSGAILPVVTYSMTVAAEFSEAARGIEQLAKGEELSINLKQERTRCSRCNRLLPEKDGICPACLNRSKTLLRIAGYLKPYRWQAVGLAALSVLGTIINLAPPYIQGSIVNQVFTAQRDLPLLWKLMTVWLLVLASGVAVQIWLSRLMIRLGSHIAADLRAEVY